MFLRLVRQEIGLTLKVKGLWALVALLIALTVIATASGALRVSVRTDITNQLMADETVIRDSLRAALQRYETTPNEGEMDTPVGAKPGALGFSVLNEYVVQPESSLSPLAVGVSDLLPNYYRLDAHAAFSLFQGSSLENPLLLRVGGFDVAFVMVFLLPIIVIALSYDIMSRERELGVLALVGAQGITLPTFIAAKVVARGVLVVLTILVANGLALSWAGWLAGELAAQAAFAWLVLALLYGLFWYALAVLVNAAQMSSATNGVVLANLWLILVVVLPAVVNLAATTLYPAPSRVALTTELREAATEAEERAAEAREQFFFDHPDMASGDVDQEVFFREVAASEADIAASIETELAAFEQQAIRQSGVVDSLKYLSPALLADRLFATIASNDRDYHDAFRLAALSFHTQWRDFFVNRLQEEKLMATADWEALPNFDYQPPPLAITASLLVPMLVLVVLIAIILIAALSGYRRYTYV